MRKANKMLDNAYELHRSVADDPDNMDQCLSRRASRSFEPTRDSTMRNFVLRGERFEQCGGFLWTWTRILDGSLFSTEGVWINTRLIIMQVAQILVAIVLSALFFTSVEDIATKAEEERNQLDPYTPQWIVDFIPTRQMIYRSLYPASIVATGVMVLLIGVYIPRYVRSVLYFEKAIKMSKRQAPRQYSV